MKFLFYLAPFLKELFFEKKGEDELDSPNFNCKRTLRWWLFVSLLTILGVTTDKLMGVTLKLIDVQAKNDLLVADMKGKDKKIKALYFEKEQLGQALGVSVVNCGCKKPKKSPIRNISSPRTSHVGRKAPE